MQGPPADMQDTGRCSIDMRIDGHPLRFLLTRLAALKLHEYFIDEALKRLAGSMARDGVLMDPPVVDEATGVVLDGAHRVLALKRLSAKFAVVYAVKYSDPSVRLGRWLRSFDSRLLTPHLGRIARFMGLVKESRGIDFALSLVDRRAAGLALLRRNKTPLVMRGFEGIVNSYWALWRLEKLLGEHGVHPQLVSDDNLENELRAGRTIAYVAASTKNEVLKCGLTGGLYPPKSTRHTFPLRPVNLRIPLAYLNKTGECPYEELRALLERRRQEYTILSPGSVYGGRLYDEELVVFTGGW